MLFLLGSFRVNIHRSFNVSMTHNFLDDLDVLFVFAKASTEGMAQVVCGKMPDQYGVAPFLIGPYRFVFDIGSTDTIYGSVDTVRRERITVSVLEDESGISINDRLIEPDYLLSFPFRFQSSPSMIALVSISLTNKALLFLV